MAKHKWTFKSRFRREAYSWNGTAKASKRMKEAVSEIKKVGKKDSSLAGEGVIELFVRLYPALMHIDSSSGALGTAMNKTIDSLMPILIKADWDMNTRGKQLDKLYDAIIEDGWGTFDSLRDYWGDLCVYPGLAHLWADQFMDCTKDVLSSTNQYCSAVDMCLSCLVYTERYQEVEELLQLDERHSWFHHKFWAMALVKQGKLQEALDYAGQILSQQRTKNSDPEIDSFCESVLLDMGKIEEAYEKYGLKVPSYGTNLNIYRGVCKKYPTIDKRKILLDLIEVKFRTF
ncbi:MAG: tetratricopeptide repeat protein [Candidatus Hodarchaeales archaeon]